MHLPWIWSFGSWCLSRCLVSWLLFLFFQHVKPPKCHKAGMGHCSLEHPQGPANLIGNCSIGKCSTSKTTNCLCSSGSVSKKETGKKSSCFLAQEMYWVTHLIIDFCLEILNQREIEIVFTLENLAPLPLPYRGFTPSLKTPVCNTTLSFHDN